MTVICNICQAANRDKAMFCSGCAHKLPTFRADGPSMLSRLNTSAWRQPRGESTPQADHPSRLVGFLGHRAARGSWFAGVMLLVTSLVAALAWNGLSSALPNQPAAHALEVSGNDIAHSTPSSTIEEASTTNAGKTTASVIAQLSSKDPPPHRPASASSRKVPNASVRDRPSPSVQPSLAPKASAHPSSDSPRDPHVGCQHLFFAFAARCAANHCFEAPYTAHPHCDQVRAETQRDEARRNMTLN